MDFSQISILFVVASAFALLARYFKQPLIVGYLFAGIFLNLTGIIKEPASLHSFSQIGVALLLFLLGLEVKLSEFSAIGKHALYVGMGQILITSTVGILFCLLLGFSLSSSFFIAIALTFSSTIVLVKLLSEKKDLSSLYGRMAIGIMLIQDFFAIAALIFLTSQAGKMTTLQYFLLPLKLVVLIFVVFYLSKKIIPFLFEKVASNSPELLFVISISWALGFSTLVAYPLGLSLEVGGYLAGIALSNLSENVQIGARTRPLKDFFLILFFINLGMILSFDRGILLEIALPALILSFFILVGSPIIIMSLMGILGYKKRTSFLTGISIAQISEFSLILVALAQGMGKLSGTAVSLVVLVGIITMTTSTYAIMHADKLFKSVSSLLGFFERKNVRERALLKKSLFSKHIILVGCHRTGSAIARFLIKKGAEFVVVDFDPRVYAKMSADGAAVVLGDVSDPEILDAANAKSSKVIISTISCLEDDLYILEYIRGLEDKPATIFTATSKSDAMRLYQKGATFVLLPEMLAGEYIRNLLRGNRFNKESLVSSGEHYYERVIASKHFG